MALDAATRERIQNDYPSFSYLLDVPEVGDLLARAVEEGWGEGRFIAELYATNYYRSRTEQQRQLETLRQLDPATAALQEHNAWMAMRDYQGRLGLNLSHEESMFLAASQLGRGVSPEDPAEKIHLLNFLRANPGKISNTGAIYQNAQAMDNLYRNEFFYVPTWESMLQVGTEIALGYQTEENVRQNLAEWFSHSTPWLAERLRGGETYATIVNPMRDIVAKELELDGLNAVDMTSSNQWRFLLGHADSNSGEMRLPSQQEVIAAARSDPRWRKTIGSTGLATGLVDGITKLWGVRV
jgi:hypothetical protein